MCLPSGGDIVQPMYLLKEKAVSSNPTGHKIIFADAAVLKDCVASYNVHLLLIGRGPP